MSLLLLLNVFPTPDTTQETGRIFCILVDDIRFLRSDVESAGRQLAVLRMGDLVTWTLPRNLSHIGVVIGERSAAGTPLIVHNIGRGPEVEDILFRYSITGHYRYRTQ